MNETNEPGPFWIVLLFISFHSNSNHICLFHLRHLLQSFCLFLLRFVHYFARILALHSNPYVHLSIDIFPNSFFSLIIFTKWTRKTCPLRKSKKKRSFMNILVSKCDSTIEYFDMMTKEFRGKRIKDTRLKTTIREKQNQIESISHIIHNNLWH